MATWFATDRQASLYPGRSKPFPVVINKTIFIAQVFILNCDAWKFITVTAFSAIPDFHKANMHFVKNLFTFLAFASMQMHISLEK